MLRCSRWRLLPLAAPWNGSILVTTGDIVHGPLPQLGAKPHATLELFVIGKTKEGFVLTDPAGAVAHPLVKTETPADR